MKIYCINIPIAYRIYSYSGLNFYTHSTNPLSYGVDALRHITIGQGAFSFGLDVAFLAAFTVVMSVIALWLFKRE